MSVRSSRNSRCVSSRYFILAVNFTLVHSSRYVQYPFTQMLFLYTTSFFSQIQKNSTLFLNPWKAIYTISSKLAKDVPSQAVLSLPSSVKSYQVLITFMQMATFIGI